MRENPRLAVGASIFASSCHSHAEIVSRTRAHLNPSSCFQLAPPTADPLLLCCMCGLLHVPAADRRHYRTDPGSTRSMRPRSGEREWRGAAPDLADSTPATSLPVQPGPLLPLARVAAAPPEDGARRRSSPRAGAPLQVHPRRPGTSTRSPRLPQPFFLAANRALWPRQRNPTTPSSPLHSALS